MKILDKLFKRKKPKRYALIEYNDLLEGAQIETYAKFEDALAEYITSRCIMDLDGDASHVESLRLVEYRELKGI